MVIMKTETEASFGYPRGAQRKGQGNTLWVYLDVQRKGQKEERSFLWNMQLQKQWTAPS